MASLRSGIVSPMPFTFGRMPTAIPVTDLRHALAFYVDILGMKLTFENGSPAQFAILKRDAAELHLTLDPAHRATTNNVAHLEIDDAAALYAHLLAHGVTIVSPIRDAEYGDRTFVLADPDGNRIDVGHC